jgi:hypothetical protein
MATKFVSERNLKPVLPKIMGLEKRHMDDGPVTVDMKTGYFND